MLNAFKKTKKQNKVNRYEKLPRLIDSDKKDN